ncbi:MAG: SPFH domain-containing protein [Micrococcales bacterium]|nr:SPFH domain-containing protein [Micrococcales bacterium]
MSEHIPTTPSAGADAATDPIAVPPSDRPVGSSGARVDVTERPAWHLNGFAAIGLALALLAGAAYLVYRSLQVTFAAVDPESTPPELPPFIAGLLLVVLAALVLSSLVIVAPGETRVVQFFGRYAGTLRQTGLSMVLPLASRSRISARVNNFETAALKVNDADGNPVEIGAIVVWQVADTAKAKFAVEDYKSFVRVQAEAALRHVTTSYPYDDPTGGGDSLRGSTDMVSDELAHEVAERVSVAGVEIVEVRISHLAYAPEIAQAMLQRQQASAIVAARSRIVEGAVGMVEMALDKLDEKDIVELDPERRAAMVSNLLVVLCGESKASPVVNAGSLYT